MSEAPDVDLGSVLGCMRKMSSTILAFDLYGTIADPSSVQTTLHEYISEDIGIGKDLRGTAAVSKAWRTQQLEYTWLLNSMREWLAVP